MFAIAGITHAINIIDGLNGIAGFTTIITLISIATIAYKVEDIDLVISSIYIIGALRGFLLFNWPFGKLFLGDGGSYFCGFCLSWSCILLVENNPSVSPFAPLLVCIYPVSESIFSIYRRIIRKQNPTGPDALHLHSLIFRRYSSRLNFYISKNSIVGFISSLFSILPCAAASYFSTDNLFCFSLVLIFIFFYIFLYIKILNFKLY
jgi:UDP-N-acetylmuramyl pentapeptide phosphotransferase/UDP-N-acetylglucosamine-1-phosphate transferase